MISREQYFRIKVPQKDKRTEREVMQDIRKRLEQLDFFAIRLEGAGKLITDEYGRKQMIRSSSAGLPDYLVLGYGTIYAVEVKSPSRNAKLSYRQAKMLAAFLSRGLNAAVVFSVDGLERFLAHAISDSVIVLEDVEIPIYF